MMNLIARHKVREVLVRCFSSARKRFYENVSLKEEYGKFLIQLDGKNVKTPLKQDLYSPTRKLANVVATEWQLQSDTIAPEKMHMTALCNTCIDNPRKKTDQEIVDEIVAFLHSDTLCARTPAEESEITAQRQTEKWDPLLQWFDNRFGVKMETTTNIFGIEQSKETVENISSHLSQFSKWQLAGLQFAVESIKSFVIPMAIVERQVSIDEGLKLSRLEVDVQTGKWGEVEWHHDVEYENQKSSLSAGILFFHLCSDL